MPLLRRVAGRLAEGVEATGPVRFLGDSFRAARAVARGFRGEKISLRASALTYITMLSLVPLLAVAFAIISALGQEELRRSVHEYLYVNLAPGTREHIGAYLDQFIARASAGAMGGLGGFFLLLSAGTLLHNIERSLNEIWGCTRSRPLLQRGLIYWAVLSLGPLLLGASLGATATMRAFFEHAGWLPKGIFAVVPALATILFLTFLYIVAPNARVRLRAAFGGALVAGIAWELAKHGYALYAAKSFRYNAIYGSLGAIPLFLLWVYVSWLLFLFGARLAFALQHAADGGNARLEDPRARELLYARVALVASGEYLAGAPPPSARRISRQLSLPLPSVVEAARGLREAGLLAEAHGGGLVPTRPPESIALGEVARAARGTLFLSSAPTLAADGATEALADLFDEADRQGREVLGRADLASLARLAETRIPAEKKANPKG